LQRNDLEVDMEKVESHTLDVVQMADWSPQRDKFSALKRCTG
jgi:hypothetical protein